VRSGLSVAIQFAEVAVAVSGGQQTLLPAGEFGRGTQVLGHGPGLGSESSCIISSGTAGIRGRSKGRPGHRAAHRRSWIPTVRKHEIGLVQKAAEQIRVEMRRARVTICKPVCSPAATISACHGPAPTGESFSAPCSWD
jgi:hypothetical protein